MEYTHVICYGLSHLGCVLKNVMRGKALKISINVMGEIAMELKVTAFVNVVVIVGIVGLMVANV